MCLLSVWDIETFKDKDIMVKMQVIGTDCMSILYARIPVNLYGANLYWCFCRL